MIDLEVWLYGPLSVHAPSGRGPGHARFQLQAPDGTRMGDLLALLRIQPDEKGITFVNGQLTDMPGLHADEQLELHSGDRVGLFHTNSMWPFQYRFGASISPELQQAMLQQEGGAIRHAPSLKQSPSER